MPTTEEEKQVKEFLKRVEIRTMRKDLLALREADAVKERNKIANIKTIDEQIQEQKKVLEQRDKVQVQKANIEKISKEVKREEIEAKQDLKHYALEPEKEQMFLLESKKFALEEKIKKIEMGQESELLLNKNKILLEIKKWHEKLGVVISEEEKMEGRQKVIAEKARTTQIPSERKSLEGERWNLDKEIQETEKKRWQIEKQIEDLEAKITQINNNFQQLTSEKNNLSKEVATIEKSLRETYSSIIEREEAKKVSLSTDELAKQQELAKIRGAEKEKIQRTQWTKREQLKKEFQDEEEQRKKFLTEVEQSSQTAGNQQIRKSDIK